MSQHLILGGVVVLAVAAYGWHCESAKANLASYVAESRAVAAAAELAASEAIKEGIARKERTDAQLETLRKRNVALARNLRDARAASRFVPPAAPASRSPDRATFNRAELERTLQQLDDEVSGIVAEGDDARDALNAAREWAHDTY